MGVVWTFFLLSIISLYLLLSGRETARFRLKYRLEWRLIPKQSTNLERDKENRTDRLKKQNVQTTPTRSCRKYSLALLLCKLVTQPANNIGPIRVQYEILYGSNMGNPYGSDKGFATRFHTGPGVVGWCDGPG